MFDCIINIQMNYKCSQVSPLLPLLLLKQNAPPPTLVDHSAPTTAILCFPQNRYPLD